jgi:heme-degrading monooxygenase HmoA
MILESAVLPVRPGQGAAFEAAFGRARHRRHIIAGMPGFLGFALHRGIAPALGGAA